MLRAHTLKSFGFTIFISLLFFLLPLPSPRVFIQENTFSNEYFRLLIEERWSPKMSHNGKPWDGPDQFEDSTGKLMMLPRWEEEREKDGSKQIDCNTVPHKILFRPHPKKSQNNKLATWYLFRIHPSRKWWNCMPRMRKRFSKTLHRHFQSCSSLGFPFRRPRLGTNFGKLHGECASVGWIGNSRERVRWGY